MKHLLSIDEAYRHVPKQITKFYFTFTSTRPVDRRQPDYTTPLYGSTLIGDALSLYREEKAQSTEPHNVRFYEAVCKLSIAYMEDIEELANKKSVSIQSIIDTLQNNPTYRELHTLFQDDKGEWDFYYMYDAVSFEDENDRERLIVLRPYLDIITELNPDRLR
jgi:hypothetical protein